ncbi:MAG: 30S ribosomal protein S17 [Rickettsiales bacterium]|jgi:small subunit ribosomal protein S17|nr:30S ribosomal protein S17 [Rickettsiales bacterium]
MSEVVEMAQNNIRVKIVRKAGDKTVVGETFNLRQHRKYKKYIRVVKRYLIHDENNSVSVGDEVFIKSSRPISKRKTWVLMDKNENTAVATAAAIATADDGEENL